MTLPGRRRAALVSVGLLLALAPAATASCSTVDADRGWPRSIRSAPAVVRQAYTFAHDHPDEMQQLPCYCGCGSIGHTSNYDCYIAGRDEAGQIVYDEHALGCSICVDITLDARRMLDDGLSLQDVRARIDAAYSPFGPSNMP